MSFGSPPSVELRFKSDRGLTVEICLGDVTEAKADGIVVPEGISFQHTGFVAQRLMEIDHKYANIREKLVQKNGSFEAWEVYTRKFGKRFKYVICGIVPPCYEDVGAWKSKLTLLYERIFRDADRKIMTALAVPLLGSGRGGGSLDDAIEVAMVSAAKFKGSNFNTVTFVSNDSEVCTLMMRACGCKKQVLPHSGTSRPGGDKQRADNCQRQIAKRKIAKTVSKHPSNKPNDRLSKDMHDKSKSSCALENGVSKEKVALPNNVFKTNNEYFPRYDWRVSDRDGATGGCRGRGREMDRSHSELFTPFESASQLHLPTSRSMATDIFVSKSTRRNNDVRGEEEVVPRFETGKRQHPRVFNDQDEFRSMSEEKSAGRCVVPPFQHDSSKRHIVSDVDEQDNPEMNSEENIMDKGYQGTDTRIHHVNKQVSEMTLARIKGKGGRPEDLGRKESQRSKNINKDLERLNIAEHSSGREQWQQKIIKESLSSHMVQESGTKYNNTKTEEYSINNEGVDYQPTKHRTPMYHDARDEMCDDECELADSDHGDKMKYLMSMMRKDNENQLQPGSKVDVDRVKSLKEKGSSRSAGNCVSEPNTHKILAKQIKGQTVNHLEQSLSDTSLENDDDTKSSDSNVSDSKRCVVNQELARIHRDPTYRGAEKAKESDKNIIPLELGFDEMLGSEVIPKEKEERWDEKCFVQRGKEPNTVSVAQSCPICLEEITDPKQLDKCGHMFCRDCVDDSFKHHKPVCPSCNMVYGVLTGNQPDGTMDVGFSGDHLPGYEGHGTITITYYFPSGIQEIEHPNPGQQYKGTTRQAYLPDCPEGRVILKLLKTAFDRKLTFTIGRSATTGQENVVTWNDIHHKTNMDGGPTRFGYPDRGYLNRVKEELASKGVTE